MRRKLSSNEEASLHWTHRYLIFTFVCLIAVPLLGPVANLALSFIAIFGMAIVLGPLLRAIPAGVYAVVSPNAVYIAIIALFFVASAVLEARGSLAAPWPRRIGLFLALGFLPMMFAAPGVGK